jgi:hypothetical protein
VTRGPSGRRARLSRLVWCVTAAIAPTVEARAQDPTRVVITRPQIESAGWFNLGEILTGATGWQRTTLDAVSFFATTDGLAPGAAAPGEPEWLVLIDGQRVTADVLGAKLLNLLPLSAAQIESVTVTRAPRLAAGTIAARGVVEFHTRQPPRGPAAATAWHSGNIIGDPGPYQFTPIGGQNVDRLGPYDFVFASFAGAGWDVAGGASQGSSHITHRAIRERFDPVLYDQLGVHKWAPWDALNARVHAAAFGGRHDLLAGRAWVNGPLFLPLAGGEQWLRGELEHVGGSGAIAAGATTIEYQLTHTALDVAELASPFPFVAGHSRSRTAGVVEVGVSGNGGRPGDSRADHVRRVRLGAGAARWSLERAGASADRTDATLFGNLAASSGRLAGEVAGALARSSGGPIVAKGVVSTRVVTDSLTALSLVLSYVQHATGDDGTWIDRALIGLDTLRRERDARAWADVGATRRLPAGLLADLGARIGVVSGVRLLATSGLPLAGASEGGLAELRAGISLPATPQLPVAHLVYRYATPLSGDSELRTAMRATPAHVLEGNLVSAVAPDLRLGAFLYVASSARWANLLGGPPTPVSLPTVSRLDVSAEKWFWHRRIRTQVLIRNLVNRSERYHPLGAEFPLRVHLTFGLALPPT